MKSAPTCPAATSSTQHVPYGVSASITTRVSGSRRRSDPTRLHA
eukprot:CAMPEP_0119138830 /NCGR_PEP_ID=MMETSP1310-20130426/26407_1 /TAXON_ID=464262 /ORGANISM="Genus nov. species nov., Strain RCC2339" /LENGTH=43 /DNA_ID= /DNA_START= /DNA_END= /DNA_ORIENTATION=